MPAASQPLAAPVPAGALETAMRAAGALALEHFARAPRRWLKPDGTPLSEADLAVDDLLRASLAAIEREAGWLSEESADEAGRRASPRTWIVDPIDGTSAFLAGNDRWSIAVALAEVGRPILAGIYRPVTDQYFSAALGQGAFLNGVAITASIRCQLDGARIITSRKSLEPARWATPWPAVEAGSMTSLALRLALVAQGDFDAAFALVPKSDWDLAAGDLIVHEAGGAMSDLAGGTLFYNRETPRQPGFVAAGKALHPQIIARTIVL